MTINSTNKPVVSIVIPTFNYGNFLPDTLKSIKNQTFENWECIVVDDGSTDDTKTVINRFISDDGRFKYFFQNNSGPSAARNNGIKLSSGEFIQFLDGDDLIEDKKLELQLQYFAEHPETDIVYGPARYFTSEQPDELLFDRYGENRPWMPQITSKGQPVLAEMLQRNIMAINCPLSRRNIFENCGYFDEQLKYYEDWEFWLRCALGGKYFAFLDRPNTAARVRFHPKSLSWSQVGMCEALFRIRLRLRDSLVDRDLQKINRAGLEKNGFDLGVEFLKMGKRREGFTLFLTYAWRPYGRNKLLGLLKIKAQEDLHE